MNNSLIINAMETNVVTALTTFNNACDELVASKYIIAIGKISKVMHSIASAKPLFQLFSRLNADYNFLSGFENAKYRDELGNPYLMLPQDAADKLRFTFCLLFALDTGRLELKTLLNSFFKNDNPNIEFNRFCNEFVVPFNRLVNDCICGKIDVFSQKLQETIAPILPPQNTALQDTSSTLDLASQKNGNQANSTTPTQSKNEAPKAQQTIADLGVICDSIVKLSKTDNALTKTDKLEIELIADSFNQAVEFASLPALRVMYVALKNTLRCANISYVVKFEYIKLVELASRLL